jgi:uncharacterized protein YkwD
MARLKETDVRAVTLLTLLLLGCDEGTVDDFDDTDVVTSTPGTAPTNGTNGNVPPGDDPYGMMAAHNAVRAGVQPVPDVPLPEMTWDANLAQVAQLWAERCDFNHSSNEYGENLYVSTAQNEGVRAVESWANEASDFNYDTNQCRDMCGHYTQIVWRDSTRVGCGYADCNPVTGASFDSGRLWVCNYDPPGNWMGERPY